MDHNIAAWMIAGGPRLETQQTRREREQLHAYLDAHRSAEIGSGLIDRIRAIARTPARIEPACCPA